MRTLSLLLLLGFFSFASVSTTRAQHVPIKKGKVKKAGKKNVATPETATPAAAGPVLTFERTPCNGTCPAYRMQVYADGRVAYEGGRFVPLKGSQALRLPAATVAEMLRRAKAAHFETFDKEYLSGATDMPGTIVAIRQPNGSLKKVTAENNAPENVKSYFTYLTAQFDQLAQLNGLEK
jgi:Domain of unknown function (DUF6438)